MQNIKPPKVSVCIVTYNQEQYIRQCLQSVVDQEVDFEVEIIVSDDYSTDSTPQIIQEFAEKYKNIIPMLRQENVGVFRNFVETHNMATGEYVCHLDGDDYWLLNKLAKQVAILDENPTCQICSHNMLLTNSLGKSNGSSFKKYKEGIHDIMDLYETLPFFAHSSKMYRNDLSDNYLTRVIPQTIDCEIHIYQAKKGNIYHIDEIMGCYRVNVGISNVSGKVNPLLVNAARRIYNDALNANYDHNTIKKYFAKKMFEFAYQSALIGNSKDASLYIKESFSIKLYSPKQLFFLLTSILNISVPVSQIRRKINKKNFD